MQYAKKCRRGSQRQQGWPERHNQSGWRDVVPAAAHLPATVKDALLPRGEIGPILSSVRKNKRSHIININCLINTSLSNSLLQKFGENPK